MRINLFVLKLLLLLCLGLDVGFTKAQSPLVFQSKDAVQLRPYFGVIEDAENLCEAASLLQNSTSFEKVSQFTPKKPDHTFWLYTPLKSNVSVSAIISFRHLTFAELFLQADTPNAPIIHRKAGAFRPIKEIKNGDSRFHFSIELKQGVPYKLLIKSTHSKKYKPVFDFELSQRDDFIEKQHQRELVDLWLQGASALLILYVFLSWLSTRYRPFIWLTMFTLGFYFYNISQNRYFIDWFFPATPQTGWLLVQSFLHLGLMGLFLLLIDSWNIKKKDARLYFYGKMVIISILIIALISFFINLFLTNYHLSTRINVIFSLALLTYAISTSILLWPKLDKEERYLVYGLALYVSATIFFNITISLWGEQTYLVTPIVTKIISITVALLFLTGLNARLRQNEKDKMRYLDELNQLQKHQNELLEQSVILRTAELKQRNERIETLMNELNHRVKNNLQLLYSLNSLQLPSVVEPSTLHILKDNIARIKAMMLVNESLNPIYNPGEKATSLNDFITEIVTHSRKMFISNTPTTINLEIDKDLTLDAKIGLSLGLIVSELITNSFKHAFINQPSPKIRIHIAMENHQWVMKYDDNGSGINTDKANTFGLTLIKDLTRQLKGNLSTVNEDGLKYFFTFPNLT